MGVGFEGDGLPLPLPPLEESPVLVTTAHDLAGKLTKAT